MSGKNINFDDKKINKSGIYKNNKEFLIDAVDVNKEPMVQRMYLNTLLDTMITMLLDHYYFKKISLT